MTAHTLARILLDGPDAPLVLWARTDPQDYGVSEVTTEAWQYSAEGVLGPVVVIELI